VRSFASFRARSRHDRFTPMNGHRQHLTQRMRAELFDKIDSKFAALQARVVAVLPDTKGAFRFARERDDEVAELPNPLPPREIN
jgi:hypothetical protein